MEKNGSFPSIANRHGVLLMQCAIAIGPAVCHVYAMHTVHHIHIARQLCCEQGAYCGIGGEKLPAVRRLASTGWGVGPHGMRDSGVDTWALTKGSDSSPAMVDCHSLTLI